MAKRWLTLILPFVLALSMGAAATVAQQSGGGGGGGGGVSLLATANTWALTQTFPTTISDSVSFPGGTKMNGQSTNGWAQITNSGNTGLNRLLLGPATVNGFALYTVNAGILRFFDGSFPGTTVDTVHRTVFAETGIVLNSYQGTAFVTWSASRPVVASGFGASTTVGGNSGTAAFTVTTGADTGGVLTMPAAAQAGWTCHVTDLTTSNLTTRQTAFSTTTVTIATTAAWTASDVLAFQCAGF